MKQIQPQVDQYTVMLSKLLCVFNLMMFVFVKEISLTETKDKFIMLLNHVLQYNFNL